MGNPRRAGALDGGNGTSTTIPENQDGDRPAALFFRDSYAVLVRGKTTRRHLYFNLPAAERAVQRALARGADADMVLVRLVRVDARHLDEGMAS
jgi:hypothetical protein